MEGTSQTGDMAAAVTAAFAASTPDAAPAEPVAEHTPASVSETPTENAIAAPAAAPVDDDAPLPEGQAVPWPRFSKVNQSDQARKKELESLGWAKGVDPKLAQSAIQLLTRAQQNPLAFTEELEVLRDHPVLGPQLRSWAARTLGFRNAPKQDAPVEDAMPEPDLHFEDGRKTYSDQQLQKRDQWLLKQWEAKIDERIEPLAKKTAANDQYVANQVWEGIQSKATSDAKTEIDTLSQQYPQFNDHRKEIAAVMEANPTFTLKQAWAEVFVTKVGPQLAAGQAATVKAKVSAGSANPARPSGAPQGPPKDFEEALKQFFPAR